ncbi:hypothetical protein EHN06_20960 (plasmid) [Marinobacter sp. NP-4(2019)]|uniref:hypothetical protein n=1 Tax=Marinobacter sp. NP-4(2019) TaxID=2488665 RepID=UPI000FC3E573|nr:hypothetical protein [Marinobacter sp. NP-4(2019)]AZT86088.1 hypothetical protein EHN06_20960 [Marinobacter sp. NP-4(2019)]
MDNQEKKPKPKSKNAEYVARFRARQKELGRTGRQLYLTDQEFEQVKTFLRAWREAKRRNAKDGYENLTDDDL